MSKQLQKKVAMFRRVHDFGLIHQAEFPAGTAGQQLFSDIGEIITRMRETDVSRITGRGVSAGNTMRRQELRTGLLAQLQAIARTAKAMPLSQEQRIQFQSPRSVGENSLLIAGHAAVEAAQPLEAEFVRYSLPAGFLAELQATLTTLENLSMDAGETAREQANDTLAQREAAAAGMATVTRLHAIVRNQFASRPLALDMWEQARVLRHGTRADHGEPAENTAPPAAGASGGQG
ncbi:MAG: hypothetical protein ACKV2V_21680 [Blastocatellia bacterium]